MVYLCWLLGRGRPRELGRDFAGYDFYTAFLPQHHPQGMKGLARQKNTVFFE
ncbi:MAG: hypothetical protein U9P82_13875 [Bacteroidota bacterium]|nr:hypothetical protein [Bacteroidota bacterium]